MNTRLHELDDVNAIRLLTAMALPKLRHDGLQTTLTPDLHQSLSTTYGVAGAAPSESDLARETLLFLATDPATASVLAAFLDGPQAESFDKPFAQKPGGSKTIPFAVAVLLALQTHVHIERDAAGKWNLLLDKPTTSEELLKPIVQKLLALPPGK